MSRQYCVLFYGQNDPNSIELLRYLSNQPFDLCAVTGLAMVCVNKPEIKATLRRHNITRVPCVLIKYYNKEQSHLQGDSIYAWIDHMAHLMGYGYEAPPAAPSQGRELTTTADDLPSLDTAKVDSSAPSAGKSSVMDTAKALQRARDLEVGADDGKAVRPMPTATGTGSTGAPTATPTAI